MTPSCWKCLLRPSVAPISERVRPNISFQRGALALFTTSATLEKSPLLKKKTTTALGMKLRTSTSIRQKKKAPVKTGKPPQRGERRAMRLRIVLSNSNAFEVSTMKDMDHTTLSTQIGTVVGLPGQVVDQLRAVQAFKTTQGWGMFRRPGCLVRAETIELMKSFAGSVEEKRTSTTVIDGPRGSGKSTMLLQAMAVAFMKGWIVINIPDGEHITAGRTDYSPIPDTNPVRYSQNDYLAILLGQICKANESILSKLELSMEHKDVPIPLQSNLSLYRLADYGAKDADIAYPIFNAFWAEITAPGRPKILYGLDGLGHIMKLSAYRSPAFDLIHAHDLALVNHFVSHLSGTSSLPNGGAVIAATNKSLVAHSPATDLALKQALERQRGDLITEGIAYAPYDAPSLRALRDVKVLQLEGLTKEETRGLMEYWAASGVLRSKVDESTIAEKWTLAGNGIVGEIERGTLRMKL